MDNKSNFSEFVLANMPYFIAVKYKIMLEEKSKEDRIKKILYIFDLISRMLTISLLSQYFFIDKETVTDDFVNNIIKEKFHHMSISDWDKLLFNLIRAYEGKRDLLFMPEIYDFYWDNSVVPNRRRVEVEQLFKKLELIYGEIRKNQVQNEFELEAEAREAEKLLNQILEKISFLANYDFIRVLDLDDNFYTFEVHKGTEISIDRLPIPNRLTIVKQWFYLQKADGVLLPLYPLMILWEESSGLTDIGLYERYFFERLQYLLVLLGKIGDIDHKKIEEFVRFIYNTVEEAKLRRKELEKLTWGQLKDICINISELRMATVKNKYRSELYQQRKKIRKEFESYMNSDKRCFVIIGKSGIGKSNFVQALSEEFQSSNDVCVLAYDGAHLKVKPSITDSISQDFDDRLIIQGKQVKQVWHEIAKVEGISNKKVILIVDAVNENPLATELLRQLDELTQSPWPWLKILLTSRPETWQVIKRGLKLAEGLYYLEGGSNKLGNELESFNYSERMDLFNNDEFTGAYEKHKKEFNLKTSYLNLRSELRVILREPLNMWLVSNTYAGREIPEKLKTTELIEEYMKSLKASGRIGEREWHLLEHQLVPIMVNNGQFNNTITVKDIDAAGESLYDVVFSDEKGSDGSTPNAPFIHLLDSEILVRQGEGIEQKISFKYERFFEYFIGQELYRNLGSRDTWEEQYENWIQQLKQTPFLWGAIKNCLEQQIKGLETSKTTDLCLKLAHTQDQRVLDIIISALVEYGSDEQGKVEQIIDNMLSSDRNSVSLLLKTKKILKKCPSWKKISIEVASNLGLRKQLEFALTDPSQSVRAVAIRHAYIYWCRDHEGGFGLLEDLSDKSIGLLGFPLLNIFEVSVGISLMILFDDSNKVETRNRLQGIWRKMFEKLLKFNPEASNGMRVRLMRRLRTVLIQVITGFIVRTASETPSNSEISIPELRLFFKRDKNFNKRRAIVRKLVPYLDPEKTNVSEIRDTFLELVDERDMLIVWISVAVLTRHIIYHENIALPILKEIFDRASKINPIGPFCSDVPFTAIILETKKLSTEAKSLEMEMLTAYLNQYRGIWWSNLQMRRFTYLDRICFLENGEVADISITPTAKRYIEKMILEEDSLWIKDLINWDITLQAIEAHHPRLALSALEILLQVKDQSVKEAIIELLARMRIYYPDEVDNFIETNNLDEQFILSVRTLTPSESLADLLDLRTLLFWQNAIVISGSRELWKKLMWLISKIADSNSLEQFLTLLLEAVVNQIYGSPVFTNVPINNLSDE